MTRSLVASMLSLLLLSAGPALGDPPAVTAGAAPADSMIGRPVAPDSIQVPVTVLVPDSIQVPDSTLVFRVEVGNRMFPDWKEEQRIHLGEAFHLGDSENWAMSPAFLPDFRLLDKKVVSASRAWNNPAIRIMVYKDSSAVDSTWAFRDFPPHYSQRSFFTFKLLEILLPKSNGEGR